jgi:outer membrane protein assembly factor BamB
VTPRRPHWRWTSAFDTVSLDRPADEAPAGEASVTAANAASVRLAWADDDHSGGIGAPTVVNGKVFSAVNTRQGQNPMRFEVRSVRTGAVLWQLALPGGNTYTRGVTVVASRARAFVSYNGHAQPGGIVAIDLSHRTIAWKRDLPPALKSWTGNSSGGSVLADTYRVYTSGADRAVIAYRLSDGRPLWSVPTPDNSQGVPRKQYGLAVANGVLYRSDDGGLTAYAASSGRRLWTASGSGSPVVAGGRVFTGNHGGITAFDADGCGRRTCSPLWSRRLGFLAYPAQVGGASGTMLFATYREDETGNGYISRLSATSGAVTWTASLGRGGGPAARGGSTVWATASLVQPDGSVTCGTMGFSAFAKVTAPLTFLDDSSCGQRGVAVAGGTVLLQQWIGPLLAYRVPGT